MIFFVISSFSVLNVATKSPSPKIFLLIDFELNPESNETIQKLYSKDLHKEIQAAIDALPPKCREVFSLSYLGELSNKEIAQQLGISVSTVENHIHSALKQLRIKLGAYKTVLLFFVLFLQK